MKLALFLYRYAKGTIIVSTLAALVGGFANSALLAMVSLALSHRDRSAVQIWIFIGLCLLVSGARIASELLLGRLGQETLLRIRLDLSRRILNLPLRRLEEMGPDRILSALTDDALVISNGFNLFPGLFLNVATFLGCMGYLAWLSWRLLALSLIVMAIGVAAYQLAVRRAVGHLMAARSVNNRLLQHFRTLIFGAKELRLHSRRSEAFLRDELEATGQTFRDANIRGARLFTIASSWGQILLFLVIGFLLFAAIDLPNSALTAFTLTFLYLLTPLQVILNSLPNFSRASIALGQIEALSSKVEAGALEGRNALESREGAWRLGELALFGVTHTYRRPNDEGEFLLGPLDLTVRPGEILFIIGGNGSGKTTLAKMLVGLYAPEAGSVRWNGELIEDVNRESYRQSFSAVFSDFFLFESLLGLGSSNLDQRARIYLERLQLDRKVEVKDGRLSTLDLSQGQRKRLALLTAYLEDRPVYLFDEWAADQDPHFREIFYRQLLPELKARGKAVVVISHDDRYYDLADRMIKLDSGQIVVDQAKALHGVLP